jgi:hypothetical protein
MISPELGLEERKCDGLSTISIGAPGVGTKLLGPRCASMVINKELCTGHARAQIHPQLCSASSYRNMQIQCIPTM